MSFDLPHLYVVRQKQFNDILAVIQKKSLNKGKRSYNRISDADSEVVPVFELDERVDMVALQRMMKRKDEFLEKGKATLFMRYAAEMQNADGLLRVRYLKSRRADYGRVYAEGSMSLCSLDRPLRSTLARNLYHDIDMENAHPRILLALAQTYKLPCATLRRYIDNREELLAEMQYERPIAKAIYLALMMIGTHKRVLANKKVKSVGIPVTAEFFKEEISKIAKRVYADHPEYHHLVVEDEDEHKSKFATVLSFMLQDTEMGIRSVAFRFAEAAGWKIGVSIHDGFLLYRREDAVITAEFLSGMQRAVANECHVDIPFAEKEFEPPYF